MERRRLIVKPIENKKVRHATFQRRKKGLLKKASEISTLCGINACVIVFPPQELDEAPETWPQDSKDVIGIIEKYKNDKSSQNKKPRTIKNYDLHEFFNDRKKQVEAETSKVKRQRLDMSFPTWDHRFDNLGEDQLRKIVTALDSKIQECDQRIDDLSNKKQSQSQSESQISQANYNMLHFDSDSVVGSYTTAQNQSNYYSDAVMKEMNAIENYYIPNSIMEPLDHSYYPDLQNFGLCEDSFSLINYGSNSGIEMTQSSSLVAYEDLKYQEASNFLQTSPPMMQGVHTNGYYYYNHTIGTDVEGFVFSSPPTNPAILEGLVTKPAMMDSLV